MEMVKFEDEGSLAPLYNSATWPGFYSSFFPPQHFTSQSLPLCQQPFLSSEPCLCASSFTSSQTSSLGYSDHFTHNFPPSPPPPSLSSDYSCPDCFLHHPPPNLPPPIVPSPNIYRSLYQDQQLAPIKAEPLPIFTHDYLLRLPPSSLPLNNSCACCASYSPTSTQLPSPPLSSTSDHHQEAMSSSLVFASRKSPTAVVGVSVGASGKPPAAVGATPKSPAAEVGGSVGGLSRVLPAQTRAQKIRAVLDEYEIASPSLIQRLMPLPVGREEKRTFVRLLRLHGVSYADIKNLGELSTSLSTLRGWDRLKKPASDRPRTPRWTARDARVMQLAVTVVLRTMDMGSPGFWRRVEEEMPRAGASHRFSAQAIAAKYDNRSRGDIARQKANTMAQ
ncbi:hypothetical protein F52700_3753 [Fusarium sp. NRRL 52700]|nr:hypothetical protein F52700_3753 [Fusarium sp. NRRL 52700]